MTARSGSSVERHMSPAATGVTNLPVAILNADATRDRAQFLAAGTQAYLTKPIDLRRLLGIFDKFLAVDREAVPASVE